MRIIFIAILVSVSCIAYPQDSTQTNKGKSDSLATTLKKRDSTIQRQKTFIDSRKREIANLKDQNSQLERELRDSKKINIVLSACLITALLILAFFFHENEINKIKAFTRD